MHFDNFFVIKYNYYNLFRIKNQAFLLLYLKKIKNQDPTAKFFRYQVTILSTISCCSLAVLEECIEDVFLRRVAMEEDVLTLDNVYKLLSSLTKFMI